MNVSNTTFWTFGVGYQLNPATSFELSYDAIDYGSNNAVGYRSGDDHMIVSAPSSTSKKPCPTIGREPRLSPDFCVAPTVAPSDGGWTSTSKRSKIRYMHYVSGRWSTMHRRMTITLDEEVYEGLYRRVGKRRMSQFIEDTDSSPRVGYVHGRGVLGHGCGSRESEALEWSNALMGDQDRV